MLCCSRPPPSSKDEEGQEILPVSGRYLPPRSLIDVLNVDKFSVIRAWGVIPEKLHLRKLDPSQLSGGVETIVCGQDHVLILSKSGQLLTAGNNKYGQCGVRIEQNVQYEELHQVELAGAKITAVAAGSYHSLLLVHSLTSQDTKVVAFGNYLGCGFTTKVNKYIPEEVKIPIAPGDKVTDVFSACNNSACVSSTFHSDSGRLFLWGELFSIERVTTPTEVLIPLQNPQEKVTKVEFGRRHAIILTSTSHIDENRVFTMGHNTYGELGLGHENREIKPKEVVINLEEAVTEVVSPPTDVVVSLIPPKEEVKKNTAKIIDITAGSRHSLLLAESGDIYGFGDNSRGQCGFEQSRSNLPVQVPTQGLFGEVTAKARFIFCGETHSAFITTSGELYMWGSNSGQKLGFQTTNDIYTPTLLDSVLGLSISGVGLGGFMTVIVTGPSSDAMIKREENKILESSKPLLESSKQLITGFLKKRPIT